MQFAFVFILPPEIMGGLLGIVAVWSVLALYKYVASLIVGG